MKTHRIAMVAAAEVQAGRGDHDDQREGWALVALAGWLAVTIAWWAAALWPLPAGTPDWVIRARLACFGTRGGAPDAGGWILLIGTPLSTLGVLVVMARRELVRGLAGLWRSRGGRFLLAGAGALILLCGHLAGVRLTSIYGLASSPPESALAASDGLVRFEREAPPLPPVSHTGEPFDLARLAGRPVVVTFAYGKCETVCPLVVHDALAAQATTRELGTAVVVVTLDPWRDTEARLPHVASSWGLAEGGYLLGGDVEAVEESLDLWDVRRARDPRTGEIAHSPLTYVLGPDGQVAYGVRGGPELIEEAVRAVAHAGAPAQAGMGEQRRPVGPAETGMGEQTHAVIPEHARGVIPEHSRAVIPDHAHAVIPDHSHAVIPAKAGIQGPAPVASNAEKSSWPLGGSYLDQPWIPASAGMMGGRPARAPDGAVTRLARAPDDSRLRGIAGRR